MEDEQKRPGGRAAKIVFVLVCLCAAAFLLTMLRNRPDTFRAGPLLVMGTECELTVVMSRRKSGLAKAALSAQSWDFF